VQAGHEDKEPDSRHSHERAGKPAPPTPPEEGHRDQGTEEDAIGPGQGRGGGDEPSLVLEYVVAPDGHRNDSCREQAREGPLTTGEKEDDEGQHDVHLLLNAEVPEVSEVRADLEKVRGGPDVRRVGQGVCRCQVGAAIRPRIHRVDVVDEDDDEDQRHELNPEADEPAQVEPHRVEHTELVLAQEPAGHDEAANDEEDLDRAATEEPSEHGDRVERLARPQQPAGVPERHQDNRESAQPVEGGDAPRRDDRRSSGGRVGRRRLRRVGCGHARMLPVGRRDQDD
jgi:hypothetical protein